MLDRRSVRPLLGLSFCLSAGCSTAIPFEIAAQDGSVVTDAGTHDATPDGATLPDATVLPDAATDAAIDAGPLRRDCDAQLPQAGYFNILGAPCAARPVISCRTLGPFLDATDDESADALLRSILAQCPNVPTEVTYGLSFSEDGCPSFGFVSRQEDLPAFSDCVDGLLGQIRIDCAASCAIGLLSTLVVP